MLNSPRTQPKTALGYVLLGLIPYTRPNMLLAFHPNQFFNELERMSPYGQPVLRTALWRANKSGCIEHQGEFVKLTRKGQRLVEPYVAQKLAGDATLMITFDVPEQLAIVRRQLRQLLRQWDFHQVQKSVWMTDRDFTSPLREAINELGLEKYAQIYECARLYPKPKHP